MSTRQDDVSTPVAFVTGARRGIGRATALAFAEAGYRVVVTSSRPDEPVTTVSGTVSSGLDDTGREIRARGAEVLPLTLDLLDRSQIREAVRTVVDRWGRVDVLVNNAIYQEQGSQTSMAATDFDALERIFTGQVVNTLFLTLEVLNQPSTGAPRTVVDIGSAAGVRRPHAAMGNGGPAFSYSASKAALHRIAPYLHVEYGPEKVRAFVLNPGVVRTEALLDTVGEIAGAMDPSVPAQVIRWLATSPEADTLAGQYLDSADVYEEHLAEADVRS